MSNEDLKSLKKTLITTLIFVLGPMVIAITWSQVSDHFATKENAEDIQSIQNDMVHNDSFQEYMKYIVTLIEAHEELTDALRETDLERVKHIETELTLIRSDLQSIGNQIGYRVRGTPNPTTGR